MRHGSSCALRLQVNDAGRNAGTATSNAWFSTCVRESGSMPPPPPHAVIYAARRSGRGVDEVGWSGGGVVPTIPLPTPYNSHQLAATFAETDQGDVSPGLSEGVGRCMQHLIPDTRFCNPHCTKILGGRRYSHLRSWVYE